MGLALYQVLSTFMSNDIVSRKEVLFGVPKTYSNVLTPFPPNVDFGALLTGFRKLSAQKGLNIAGFGTHPLVVNLRFWKLGTVGRSP